MKTKYKIYLTVITMFLFITIMVLVHYNILLIGKDKDMLAMESTGCVSVIYSDDYKLSILNPRSYSNEDVSSIIPYTVTITNYCEENKEVSLYIDNFSDSNISDSKMNININGDVNVDTTKISSLDKVKGEEDILYTYKVFKVNVSSYETKRVNLRIWLDENESLSGKKNVFDIKYYVIVGNKNDSFAEKLRATEELNNVEGANYLVNKRYLKFADIMWQVVCINEDNSIKLMYANSDLECNFNSNCNRENYVSYEDSSIKKFVDNFYETNLKDYDSYIKNSNYYIDNSYTKNYNRIIFGAYQRMENNTYSTSTFESDKEYGGLKEYKIGLLTSDEVVLNDLYEDYDYYTMSPAAFNNYKAYVLYSSKEKKIDATAVNNKLKVKPVINLDSCYKVKGLGTINNPYELVN